MTVLTKLSRWIIASASIQVVRKN